MKKKIKLINFQELLKELTIFFPLVDFVSFFHKPKRLLAKKLIIETFLLKMECN